MSAILGSNRLGHNKRKFVACRVSADKKYKRSNPQRNRCPRDEPTIPREHRAKGQRAIVERACTQVSDDVHALQRTEMPRLAHARALTRVDTHLSVSLVVYSLSLSLSSLFITADVIPSRCCYSKGCLRSNPTVAADKCLQQNQIFILSLSFCHFLSLIRISRCY